MDQTVDMMLRSDNVTVILVIAIELIVFTFLLVCNLVLGVSEGVVVRVFGCDASIGLSLMVRVAVEGVGVRVSLLHRLMHLLRVLARLEFD